MTNAGELKFWQLQNSPEKKEKKARSLTSVRVTSLLTWEESKNLETILLLLLFFYFYLQHFRCIKKCSSLFICYIFVWLGTSQ